MLVETAMVLLAKARAGEAGGGVTTPAAALGSAIVQRLQEQTKASFELSESPSAEMAVEVRSAL